jgi:colanic acid biosynthesis glycosyl transferase WcaI
MRILLLGLNYSPEEIGVGKYSGEMAVYLANRGDDVTVVTSPPYYPHWKIAKGYSGLRYSSQLIDGIQVVRCPLWVPRRINGWKRIVHLASFGLSSLPATLWSVIGKRPDTVIVIEPAAFSLPTAWLAARLSGAKTWLHIQDFEVDAAFELGILKQPLLKRIVRSVEAFWMRRFDRVSSISPKMVAKLSEKGVQAARTRLFPNWVDCEIMKPISDSRQLRQAFGIPEDKCIALYAGNIGKKQGLEIVVQAAKYCENRSDIHFVICGNGAAQADLLKASRGQANLQWLPVQPMERFNELMNCADIHLLPQRGDAADLVMPSKLCGMLATEKPVLACAHEGTQIAQVVAGLGRVVPPDDASAFCNALTELADDREERKQLGAAARRYALEHLGKEAILRPFAIQLEELVRQPSRTPHPRRIPQEILEK